MNIKTVLRIVFLLALAALATFALRAQESGKASILRPPAGAKVALIEFADLECPDCARAAPLLVEAEKLGISADQLTAMIQKGGER